MLTEAPVPKEPTADSRGSRRLDVQGLRAVAVILVVAFHSGLPVRGGFIGVDVFLVISGFVIMGMLLRELEGTGGIRLRHFYARRIKRLLPALALLTTVVVVLSVFFGSSFGSQQTTARTGLGATFFTANIVIYNDETQYFGPAAESNPLLHTWTLSVEEQVYLVFPSLLLGGWLAGRRFRGRARRGAVWMLALVAVPSFALSVATSFALISVPGIDSPGRFAFYSSLTRIWEFAVGAALALGAARLARIPAVVSSLAGIVGAAAIVVGAFTISGLDPYPGLAVIVPVVGAAAVIVAGFGRSMVSRLLSVRPMVTIGDLSYSWYLWHWPFVVYGLIVWPYATWLSPVLGLVSLLPAWASTRYLEDPIRHDPQIRGKRVVRLAAVCTVVPTLACLALAVGARTSWWNDAAADMQDQVRDRHVAASRGCDEAGASLDDPRCQFNRTGAGPRVYLVGNSVAAQYSEAVIVAGTAVGSPVTIDTSLGCAFGARANVTDRQCGDTLPQTIEALVEEPPGIVVMSSTWDLGILGQDVDPSVPSTQEQFEGKIADLTGEIRQLRDAGHQVIMVLPTPKFFRGGAPGSWAPSPKGFANLDEAHTTSWEPSDCWNITALQDPAKCGASVGEAAVEAAQADTMAVLVTVAAETGATTMDLRDAFCEDGACATNRGNRWLFRDGVHISASASEALGPVFAGAMRASMYANEGRSVVWLATACTVSAGLDGLADQLRPAVNASPEGEGIGVLEQPDQESAVRGVCPDRELRLGDLEG